MQKHLLDCRNYLKKCSQARIANNTTRKATEFKPQIQISFPKINTDGKQLLDHLAAEVCLLDGHPFALFKSEAIVHTLNPAYTAPTRKTIAGPLLEDTYQNIKLKIEGFINGEEAVNVITDESSNINHSRICKISIHTPYGTLHYISEDIGAQ
jgi:hypothetical protein